MIPESCDYLIVGGGATGLAFADTLLKHHVPASDKSSPSVIMIDKHDSPGGQWNDSYAFVRLHQPSAMYGVETEPLEPNSCPTHRATRAEILEYYEKVQRRLESQYNFQFFGGITFDFEQAKTNPPNEYSLESSGKVYTIQVRKRLVDARFLEPDLPIFVGPKFSYNAEAITCVPVNSLVNNSKDGGKEVTGNNKKHYVVIGGGKTGMDAVTYLLTQQKVDPDDILWVVPNEAWITAREEIHACIEFLHTCASLAKNSQQKDETMEELIQSPDFLQNGFLEWEQLGRVYRFDKDILPTKFKDATLCQMELKSLQRVLQVVRHGRVSEITNSGALRFVNGTVMDLPWPVQETVFIHCSAGAFNYTKQPGKTPPVFSDKRIVIQDVYGTPGFCFVGSIVAMLECMDDTISDDEKNRMLLAPQKKSTRNVIESKLGPSGGDIGVLSSDHGYVQRVSNLRNWLQHDEIRDFLMGHRLFNLGYMNANEMETMVNEIWQVLVDGGLVKA